MPKTLFLVRHAKSSWADPGQHDFDRPLNNRGRQDSPKMGTRLLNKEILPQVIICSTAVRARQTLNELNLGIENIIFAEKIYEASAETLLNIVQSIDDTYETAMVIGHNPGMSWLVSGLTETRIANLPTCAIARITLKSEEWKDAGMCPAELVNLDYPKKSEDA